MRWIEDNILESVFLISTNAPITSTHFLVFLPPGSLCLSVSDGVSHGWRNTSAWIRNVRIIVPHQFIPITFSESWILCWLYPPRDQSPWNYNCPRGWEEGRGGTIDTGCLKKNARLCLTGHRGYQKWTIDKSRVSFEKFRKFPFWWAQKLLIFVRKWLRKLSPKMPTPLEKRHAFGSH